MKNSKEFNMTYFDALTEKRRKKALALDKNDPEFNSLFEMVKDIYSDSAHFIYELLQNADDAGAKSAQFLLKEDCLVFIHNGTKNFTISDPDSKSIKEDQKLGRYGDINAITAICFSSKKDESNKVGKFGVGFKSVFQYTTSPHIYDPNIRFKIEDYIIPIKLDKDYDNRSKSETVFVFPFNNPEIPPERAYSDILEKLENLENPVLFLQNLKEVHWMDTLTGNNGLYKCELIESIDFNETKAEHFRVHYDDTNDCKYIWLFSRQTDNNLRYCVGFWFDENENFIPWPNDRAYCFFTTSENTHLNFIIHAPFLLTQNRANIKAKEKHNLDMIQFLAELASDSLVYFRDMSTESHLYITDKIFDLIPIDETVFNEVNDPNNISFKPFYTEIKNKFNTECLIPGIGHCVFKEHAYWAWANIPKLVKLFPNDMLKKITGDPDAEWILPNSDGRDSLSRSTPKKATYISNLYKTCFVDSNILNKLTPNILNKLTPEFIEEQSVEWLTELYTWCTETDKRLSVAAECPIFLNNKHQAVKKHGLYLPVDNMEEMSFLHSSLIENDKCRNLLIEKFRFCKPSLIDYIKEKIIPYYENENPTGERYYNNDFNILYDYYQNHCTNSDRKSFIDSIKELYIIKLGDKFLQPKQVYLPNDVIGKYLKMAKLSNVINLDDYLALINCNNARSKDDLIDFFIALGMLREIKHVQDYDYADSYSDLSCLKELYPEQLAIPFKKEKEYNDHLWKCGTTKGLINIIKFIKINKNIQYSKSLWKFLCLNKASLPQKNSKDSTYYYKKRRNKYFTPRDSEDFYSPDYFSLKLEPWLLDKNNNFVSASELLNNSITDPQFKSCLDRSMLSDQYDMSLPGVTDVCDFLGITDSTTVQNSISTDNDCTPERYSELCLRCSEFEKKNSELEKKNSELEKKIEEYQGRDERKLSQQPQYDDFQPQYDDFDSSHVTERISQFLLSERERLQMHSIDVSNQALIDLKTEAKSNEFDYSVDTDEDDTDTYMPTPVDYKNRISQNERHTARKICELERADRLQHIALSREKYSFGWFKALIELEACQLDDEKNSRKFSISFDKIEREDNTSRTLILKHPNKPIPAVIEDLADISMTMSDDSQQYSVVIEVASIKSFTLRVKVRSMSTIKDIDLNKINYIHIEAKSPAFLWNELLKGFCTLKFDDSDNMQKLLPQNVEFIFGPPGTGKTTYLAKKLIIPKMHENCEMKILVLTPTNKAADVLTRRLMSIQINNFDYKEWLIRFGGTADDYIEKCGILRDRSYNIDSLSKYVLITTIARFPYDYYILKDERVQLTEIDWDFIIIDEASMIPIANIIYPLFKNLPEMFYIAGDPFQIEPITSIDLWANENIFTMTELKSFSKPQTIPHHYRVTTLNKQYRCIPTIGEVFSRFKYDAILEHHRKNDNRISLNIDIEFDALNLIKFPVKRYESIYRCKRLNQSNYQIYSALFTYEFVSFLAHKIAKSNPNCCESFKFGIVSPYRVQADLISKLIERESLPEMIEITAGTIHSFQGDECNIMFAVFNPPESITSNSFVNRDSIINVSLSRARDYLFVIMPDEHAPGINNLEKVNLIERIMKQIMSDSSSVLKCYYSNDLEKLMFGSKTYLEDNAFTTSHQSVNVYSLPEKIYEIRSDLTAIDIQVNRSRDSSQTNSLN